MTRDIDHGVECLARERRKTAGDVAVDPYEARARGNRPRKAAGSAGHVMAGRASMACDRASEELAAAENENAHVTVRVSDEIERLQRQVAVATDPSARPDLRVFRHRALELPVEQPHGSEDLAVACGAARPVGPPECKDAVVAQVLQELAPQIRTVA
ncbi:hypothetical protein QIH91_33065 [Bradyrhizobium japonicum USDA 135]|nr:hypothetical protein QIH91_33065 [Bradyrhizobium japonicum USDA 135]